MSKSTISRQLGRHRETIILWIQGIERHGLKNYLDKAHQACKAPRPSRQVDALVKRYIWAIREREEQCCGQKIAYFLAREHGVKLSVPKIYEVLAEKYVLRSRKPRYQQRGCVPEANAARQVLQVDTVHFGQVFAFTAVDIFSREADVILRRSVTADDGVVFLRIAMARRFNSGCPLGGSNCCKAMAGRSSKASLQGARSYSATGIASLDLTRKMSKPTSRVSTAL
jgi:transposase